MISARGMLAHFARRASGAILARPCVVPAARVSVVRRFSAEAEAEGEGEEKPSEVAVFLQALGLDSHEDKFANMKALLYDTKTDQLQGFGLSIQERKKLLSHVEKYKRGLWAPRELRR